MHVRSEIITLLSSVLFSTTYARLLIYLHTSPYFWRRPSMWFIIFHKFSLFWENVKTHFKAAAKIIRAILCARSSCVRFNGRENHLGALAGQPLAWPEICSCLPPSFPSWSFRFFTFHILSSLLPPPAVNARLLLASVCHSARLLDCLCLIQFTLLGSGPVGGIWSMTTGHTSYMFKHSPPVRFLAWVWRQVALVPVRHRRL